MASLYRGAEAVEESVAATLRTYLPAILASIYTSANDGVPNAPVAQFYAGSRDVIPEYPAIVVTSIDGAESLDGSPVWGEVNHRLDISAICQSDDHRTLDRQTKRLLWAIWDTLKQHQSLDGALSGLAGVSLARYGRSDAFKPTGKHLIQVAAWEAIVRMSESTF